MTGFLARASARRPWLTVLVWVALVVVAAILINRLLGSATTTELGLSESAESARASKLLEDRLRGPEPLVEIIIVQSDTLTVDAPEFQGKVESVFDEIMALGSGTVISGRNYYQESDVNLLSADRKTTLIQVVLAGSFDEATVNVEHVMDVVREANAADDFRVLIGGTASIAFEFNELNRRDLEQGERFGLPVALIILLILFGTVTAAMLPIGLSVFSIIVALGLAAVIGQAFELVFFVTMMITMIGLAVGIDYSLLIVSRFREEMGNGLNKLDAVERAGETAGRTVLFSGATVVIALCGMFIVPASFFQSVALGTILVVIISMAATLTLLPAVLALLGLGVNKLRVPLIGRTQVKNLEVSRDGFWEATTRIVTRFPVISIVAIGIPMLVVTVFYFQIDTGVNGVDTFPEGAQTKEAFFVLEEEFSFGLVNPTEIVIEGNINDPQVQGAIAKLQESLGNDPRFPIPPVLVPNISGDLALLTLPIPGESRSRANVDAVTDIREQHIPSAFGGIQADVYVGGATALAADLNGVVDRYTPIVFAFVLGFSFVVLLLVFRSVVIPLKAVSMNLLSVGTAYGMMVLVFQKGVGTDLLGFQHAEVIDVWIPLFLFTILFGLSMDYHVFLLSRIRERYDQTGNNTEAISYGLRSTTGIITGAALIMVAVFGAFASGQTIINQQVGFGLAVAILLDATLVRSVLVPAMMEVLGRGNWYLPSWLEWLPDMRVEPAEE